MSIWSYPDRGPWGKSSYRGNASGHVYKDLYRALGPNYVIDPCMGSGTSIEVAEEMGIQALGLDLHSGFNLLRDSILEASGRPADLVVSHFPYHDMVVYSGKMYKEIHSDDLSRCASVEEFLQKSQQALLNQRDATLPGGHYATLIGDMRRNGQYYSFQSDFIARMPADELKGVIVKAQHNCVSDQRQYGGAFKTGLPRITHEYLLVWQRPVKQTTFLLTLRTLANQAQNQLRSTWRSIIRQAMVALGGEASLADLYNQVAGTATEKLRNNANWQAKVRQVLQTCEYFQQVKRGYWALT